jgi:O-antigen/teichoic acid export membrane protein
LTDSVPLPSNDDADRARNIVQGMGLLTLQNLATSVMGFVFLFVIIRWVPLFQYGVYSAVLVIVSIATTIAGMGVNLAATRFVALHSGENDAKSWDAARKILLLSLLLTGVTTSFLLVISPLLSLYFVKNTTWTWAFLMGGGWVFSASIANTFMGILQGLKRYAQLAKTLFFSRLAMTALTIGLLYFFRTIEFPFLGWILFYVFISVWIFSSIGKNMLESKGDYKYSTIIRYSLPLGIAAIIAIFATSSDSVVVGGYLNPASLGIYQAAISVSTVLGVVAVTPLSTALFPEISSAKTSSDISNGVRLTFRFATFVVLPTSLFVVGVSTQLLSLFASGEKAYLAGTFTLELIALFYVFVAIQTVLLVLLQAIGKTLEVILVGVVTATSDIGIALLLVPHFGLAGAVTSRVAVSLDGAVVAMYLSRKYMGHLDRPGFYLKAIFCSFIPSALIFLLSTYYSSRLFTLVPYAVLFFVIYLACVKFLHLVTQEDRTYLSHTLPARLRKFADYL